MKGSDSSSKQLDLRGTPCPLNFVRCCLAVEELEPNESLQVFLDRGEPESMVIPGLEDAGHLVEIIQEESSSISLLVRCSAG